MPLGCLEHPIFNSSDSTYSHSIFVSLYGPHLIQTSSLHMQSSTVHPLESAAQDMQKLRTLKRNPCVYWASMSEPHNSVVISLHGM